MTINVGDKVRIKDVGEDEFPEGWDGLVGEVRKILPSDDFYDGWEPTWPFVVAVENAPGYYGTTQEFCEKELEVINA